MCAALRLPQLWVRSDVASGEGITSGTDSVTQSLRASWRQMKKQRANGESRERWRSRLLTVHHRVRWDRVSLDLGYSARLRLLQQPQKVRRVWRGLESGDELEIVEQLGELA